MTTLAIKWAYRFHTLTMDWYDTLEEAISMAGYASDDGQEALDCIEVWDDDGHRVIPGNKALRLYEEKLTAEEAAAPPPKPVVARLFVTSPEGKEICYSTYTAADRVEQDAARLREHLGDRVRVQMIDGQEAPDA